MTTVLGDHPVIADAIRVAIIFVGFTLALVTAKIALHAVRSRQWDRLCATMSFALIVITPSTIYLFRFEEPLLLWPTITYCTGLALGVVAYAFRLTIRSPWWDEVAGHRGRRKARRRTRVTR